MTLAGRRNRSVREEEPQAASREETVMAEHTHYTYCLHCATDKVRYVSAAIQALSPACHALIPRQVQHTWKDGKMINRLQRLFPGYLFLYDEFPLPMYDYRYLPGVIRVLRTTDEAWELSGPDESFALFLLEKDGVLGKTKVLQENDILTLPEDVFGGADARILKVDRRARRMKVLIHFARQEIATWLEYEVDPELCENADECIPG